MSDLIIKEGGELIIKEGGLLLVKLQSFFALIGEDAVIWFMFMGLMLFSGYAMRRIREKKREEKNLISE